MEDENNCAQCRKPFELRSDGTCEIPNCLTKYESGDHSVLFDHRDDAM